MRYTSLILTVALAGFFTACDVQSGMTKKGLEKYNESPTPPIKAATPEPIDPADVITVDAALAGPNVNVNTPEEAKKAKCDKYNRVSINTDGLEVNIAGACKQITLNSDNSKVTVTAVSEVVINGTGNTVSYAKYVNGKHVIVNDNAGANTVTRVAELDTKETAPAPGKGKK